MRVSSARKELEAPLKYCVKIILPLQSQEEEKYRLPWIKSQDIWNGCEQLLGVGGLRRGHKSKDYFWNGLGW